jgi:small subunit ribosomal protein S21
LVKVELKPNETQQKLYSRFKRSVNRAGILREVKKRKYFVSRTEERRLEKKKMIRKNQIDIARSRARQR